MNSFIIYAVIGVGLIWAFNTFKQFLVHKALESKDAETVELKKQEQVFKSKAEKDAERLKAIEEEQKRKSEEDAANFWKREDGK